MLLKKKLKKILFVLVAVIIAFSCCCISSSAAEASTNINSFSDFFDFNSAFFFYLRDGASSDPSSITSTDWVNYSDYIDCDVNGDTLTLKLSGDTNWGQWQWYKVTCSFNVKENYRIKAYSNGSFSIRVDDSTSVAFLNNNYLPNVLYKFGSFDTLSSNLQWEHFTKLNAVIPRNVEIGTFRTISVDFYFYGKKTILSTDTLKFNFGSLNVSLIDETQQMVNTIVQNQNENTDKLMANQDKNTDKILNGGSDKPHYSGTDKTQTDNYQKVEEEINNVTADSRSASVSLFNNFGNILSNLQFQKGLLAVSKLMTDIFSIDWLATVIQFALVVGSFAFILGMASLVIGRFSSSDSKSSKKRG